MNINHLTQPTQIIDRSTSPATSPLKPIVQVAASSPTAIPYRRPGGLIASTMAPAGTTFRPPIGVSRPVARPTLSFIDLSSDDDGPRYQGGSSDSDTSHVRKNDIKTANFVRNGQNDFDERVAESPSAKVGSNKFQEITAKSFYKPVPDGRPKGSNLSGSVFDSRNRGSENSSSSLISSTTGAKRSSDTLANAYGSVARTMKKPRQTGPSRPVRIDLDPERGMTVDDIQSVDTRQKVRVMLGMLQLPDVKTCYDALMLKHGNVDDATEYMIYHSMTLEEIEDYNVRQNVKRLKERVPTQSVRTCHGTLKRKQDHFDEALDDLLVRAGSLKKGPARSHIDLTGSEDELMMTPALSKAKQQARAPVRSIQDKWGSTQLPKKIAPQSSISVPEVGGGGQPIRQGGRLVRGLKKAPRSSSPIEEPKPHLPARKVMRHLESSDSDESASRLQSASDDGTFEGRLLAFFNDCSPADLADTASISQEIAAFLVSKRPFKNLTAVQQIQAENTKPAKSKRMPAPIGERVVDKCEEMIISYEAVDTLVKQCDAIGKPLVTEMKSWGIDIFGTRDGELDLVSLKGSQPSAHDSGIGTPVSDIGEEVSDATRAIQKSNIITQPSTMSKGMKMKDYQIVGINWLSLLFRKQLSCILADDMGLGKTCQVIAFLAHLSETGEKGPHLVVVPSSTLENWLAEFQKFCPALVVRPLYAALNERAYIREEIEVNREEVNVVITTYTTAKSKEDFAWLKSFGFCCTIFDEGHYLKNAESQLYMKLVKINSRFRLLLTGTPLQNNLRELISLLGFLLPALFREKNEELKAIFTHKVKATDDNHGALLSAQRIARARSMLTPFILRRKKHQVLKDLPSKVRRVVYCEMNPEQIEIYTQQQEKARQIMARRAAGDKIGNQSANVLIRLRQAALHPFMFRRVYDDQTLRSISKACIKDPQWATSNPSIILEELSAYSDMEVHQLCMKSAVLKRYTLQNNEWMASGKVSRLVDLLLKFKEEGHRTLLFSQFVMVMDILELVLQSVQIPFFRLDGGTKVEERQDLINEFSADENETPVFMLSTKAGGAGINLAKANKVIIFDSGFNPQDDIQAENRAHRIGQDREVEVIRLISRGSVEEQIHAMGLTKLALDERVAGDEIGDEDGKVRERREAEGLKLVEEMFFKGLQGEEGKGGCGGGREETRSGELVVRGKVPMENRSKIVTSEEG